MNIIVGGIMQESNTFSEATSGLDDFRRLLFLEGEELLADTLPGGAPMPHNELAGFRQAAQEQGVRLAPTLFMQAASSGRMRREPLDELKRLLLERLAPLLPCDGLLFAFHGAWVAEDNDDATGEFVAMLRAAVGPDVPIVISLDSHANVTRQMAANIDGLIGYRTFPHIDHAETGYRAASLLFAIARGEIARPVIRLAKAPMIVPAENHTTDRGPMLALLREAAEGERAGDSLATSLFAVQPWLDVAEMGFGVVVLGADAARAEAEAERLAALAWSKREQFAVRLYSVEEAVRLAPTEPKLGPLVISDSADSPGAGSPGDSNFVLRRLLALGAERELACLLSMVDAPAARLAVDAGEGGVVKLEVGHSISRSMGEPFAIEARVVRVGGGTFRFGGGMAAGVVANMGRCAVVAIGSISLLLMEYPVFTGDPAMYRSVGLEPADADVVLVKSASQFRAEYEKLTSRICILDTPGASTANLTGLTFRRVPRPMYPFEDHFLPEGR
ncbi:MAG: M81 family metallopeptidase [Paenibacillaceae bacterium]|nr:M81 family metallopeptidase [Paenibacillaceae bacterium]